MRSDSARRYGLYGRGRADVARTAKKKERTAEDGRGDNARMRLGLMRRLSIGACRLSKVRIALARPFPKCAAY